MNQSFTQVLLRINRVFALGIEILNPIIGFVVFLTVLIVSIFAMGDGFFRVILSLILASISSILVCGPLAVLTNIQNNLSRSTDENIDHADTPLPSTSFDSH